MPISATTHIAQEAVGSEISGLSEKGGVITIDGFSKTAGHRCDRGIPSTYWVMGDNGMEWHICFPYMYKYF